GEDGIRTREGGLGPLTGLANRRYRPLSHLSGLRRKGFTSRRYLLAGAGDRLVTIRHRKRTVARILDPVGRNKTPRPGGQLRRGLALCLAVAALSANVTKVMMQLRMRSLFTTACKKARTVIRGHAQPETCFPVPRRSPPEHHRQGACARSRQRC